MAAISKSSISLLTIAVAGLLMTAVVAPVGYRYYLLHNANALLADVKGLRIGESSFDDAMAIAEVSSLSYPWACIRPGLNQPRRKRVSGGHLQPGSLLFRICHRQSPVVVLEDYAWRRLHGRICCATWEGAVRYVPPVWRAEPWGLWRHCRGAQSAERFSCSDLSCSHSRTLCICEVDAFNSKPDPGACLRTECEVPGVSGLRRALRLLASGLERLDCRNRRH